MSHMPEVIFPRDDEWLTFRELARGKWFVAQHHKNRCYVKTPRTRAFGNAIVLFSEPSATHDFAEDTFVRPVRPKGPIELEYC